MWRRRGPTSRVTRLTNFQPENGDAYLIPRYIVYNIMTLLQTLRRNSLINLTSACEIVSKASFQSACETFLSHRPNKLRQKRAWLPEKTEETYFRFRTIAVSFFIFPPFFLPSFTVKSGSVTGCSIKIYRPGEKTRERERGEGKEKKMLSTALTLLFPFTLVSSSRGTVDEQVYRTTRRIMNRNAGIVFRSGSRLTRF